MLKSRQEKEKKYYIFIRWPCPNTRTPGPSITKLTNLVDSFLVIIIILSVCLIYAWVNRRRFNAYSLHVYDIHVYGHALAQKPLL